MDLKWEMDNPILTLEKYMEDVKSFSLKKETNEVLRSEVVDKTNEISEKKDQLENLKEKLAKMKVYVSVDTEKEVAEIQAEADKKIRAEQAKYDSSESRLTKQRDRDIQANDEWLSLRLKELLGEDMVTNVEMTEIEQKALDFEITRRKYHMESDAKINEYSDSITQEKLDSQTVVGKWKQEQDEIYKKFEPNVDKYQKIIEEINRNYQPEITESQKALSEKITARDTELGQLQLERDREVQLSNNEIQGHQKTYKQTDRQFSEQIRLAKLQNKPTTRMENSKTSRLNAINDQIQKVNNRLNKKLMAIDQKIEVASGKHARQIEKFESRLNDVIRTRDQELSSPTEKLNLLTQDRDKKILQVQSKINAREAEASNKISDLNNKISNEKYGQNSFDEEIDSKIVDYVMQGHTCFDDVLNEANAPFIALENKISCWMELISQIKKDKMSSKYPVEHEKQKKLLMLKDYQSLQEEIRAAEQFNNTLSPIAKKCNMFVIIGSVLAGLGFILAIIMFANSQPTIASAGIGLGIVGIVLFCLTFLKTNNEFSRICKFVSLATDYKEFPSISDHSTQITQARELDKMKQIGTKLYDTHYGKKEAQDIHRAKDSDIKSDYLKNLKLIQKEFENQKEQIKREEERAVKKVKRDAAEGEERFNSEKSELQNDVDELVVSINVLYNTVRTLEEKIKMNEDFMRLFEKNYEILENKLGDGYWYPAMEYTHGKLSNKLYIVPERGDKDECGHKKIYRIDHGKKALVITYDVSSIGDGDDSEVEQIGMMLQNLLFDLMYSVYRMNSKDTYAQYIVDGMNCTSKLKEVKVKNAFRIKEVVHTLDELKGHLKSFSMQREKLAEKGTNMDDINESRFKSQDRPEVYNIVYVIYKPKEKKARLEDELRSLIPECDKYGFLPVFICEKETWDNGLQDKESIYKDIKSMINNLIVEFDGINYLILN